MAINFRQIKIVICYSFRELFKWFVLFEEITQISLEKKKEKELRRDHYKRWEKNGC